MKAYPTKTGDDFALTLELEANDSVLIATDEQGRTILTFASEAGRNAGRLLLRGYGHGLRELSPIAIADRVTAALRDAAARVFDNARRLEARQQFASTVLHRLADQVKGGSVIEFAAAYSGGDGVTVSFKVENWPGPPRMVDLVLPDDLASTVGGT